MSAHSAIQQLSQAFEILFGSGEAIIRLKDNLANAGEFKQGTNSYLKFVTTDSGEKVVFGQGVDVTGAMALSSTLTIGGVAIVSPTSLATGAGAGFTDGVGAIYLSRVTTGGGFKKTEIFLDLTGTASSTTDLDIIGTGTSAAYIAKLTAAECGTTIDALSMTCLEAPAGGVADIDLYSATEGTGKFDDAVASTLTETALITAGGSWTNGATKGATVVPLSTEYLYLTGGAGGTAAAYTAGKFLITIYGH